MESLTRPAAWLPVQDRKDDSKVSVLPPEDHMSLTDSGGAYRHHRFHPTLHDKKDLQYADKFKEICKRKYTSLCLAWRLLLDVEGNGRVSFQHFCRTVKRIGFKEPKRLWCVVNTRKTNFLTLDEWDPLSFRNLYEFRAICLEQYGSMDCAFNYGMDTTGSRTVTIAELENYCERFDFTGDVKVLFEALDMHQHGFITHDELEFLAQWEGEKHGGNCERFFDFHLSRLNWRRHRGYLVKKAKLAALPTKSPTPVADVIGDAVSMDDLPKESIIHDPSCDA